MKKTLLQLCYAVLVISCVNIYAVSVTNIIPKCPDGSTTAGCKCGDGFVQTNLGEKCDLGTAKNGQPDYGCTATCQVVANDPSRTWECNTVTNTYSSAATLSPEKSEFNKLYLEMVTLYKTIKNFTTTCNPPATIADRQACSEQQIRVETFISMNKHKPFLCDSFNDADKISANAYPDLKYIDMVSMAEKTLTINYETGCGLGNMLLVPTKLKWAFNTDVDYETLYGCKMNFIKTTGNKFVRHSGWVMYFLDDPTGAISQITKDVDTQGKFDSHPQRQMINDLIYCVRKIPPADPRSASCEDRNLCYDILAKAFNSNIELRKFNNVFDFTKNTAAASGVKTFPAAMHIGGSWNPSNPAVARDATELWNSGTSQKFGVGYFTIYPEGSTFPWFRPL